MAYIRNKSKISTQFIYNILDVGITNSGGLQYMNTLTRTIYNISFIRLAAYGFLI